MRRRVWLMMLVLCGGALAADNPEQWTKAGNWKRARPLVEAALRQNPKDVRSLVLMCRIHRVYRELDAAEKLCARAIAVNAKDWEAHWEMGQVYADQVNRVSVFRKVGFASKIRGEFEAAVAADPNSYQAHYALMSYYLEAPGIAGGDKNKARSEAAIVARLAPAWGFIGQAKIAEQEKRLNELDDLYRKAHDADPKNVETAFPHCRMLATRKNWAEAEQCSADLVKVDPGRVSGYGLLAYIYVSQQKWAELDAAIGAAERNVPGNYSPHYQAASVLAVNGADNARAERYLRQYLAHEPEPTGPRLSRAHWRLGQVLEKMGRKPDAVAELRVASQMEPDFKPAADDLKRLR